MKLVHERMNCAADFGFIPAVQFTQAKTTVVVHSSHCWDVTTWLDGSPDLLTTPTSATLAAAGGALADLHRVWSLHKDPDAPCSAVARQLVLLAEWDRARFAFPDTTPEGRELVAALALVGTRLPRLRAELLRLCPVRGRVVPIHGDFWPENLLFRHDRLTAVLDFGNVGYDHPEVDLGRLFADVPGADRSLIATAVESYNANAPFALSVPLVELLAASGRLCSLANWHLRLNAGSPDAHLLPTALPRVRRLVALISDADRVG